MVFCFVYLLTSITAFTWAAMPEKYGMIDRMDFRLRHENTLQCENREVKRVKRKVKNGALGEWISCGMQVVPG